MTIPQAVDFDEWQDANWELGANFDQASGLTSFAVYAPAAEHVEIEIYREDIGEEAIFRVAAVNSGDGIWRARLANAGHGTLYGYRLWGRNWPYQPEWTPGSAIGFKTDRDEEGNHFNPNKLLLDPYAREVTHTPMSPRIVAAGADRGVFVTGGASWRNQIRRFVDSAKYAPKGIVIHDHTRTGLAPDINEEDVCIYEVHVKNLTMHPSACQLGDLLSRHPGFSEVINIPNALRGTYAGAAQMAPYLKSLGVNTIEFLPVHETDSDQVGENNGTTNNWGYQTLNYFSPNRDYSSDKSPGGPTREFKNMVRAFHDSGINVYIDVVFNHTSEGGNWDKDLDSAAFTSFGGFATTDYYDLGVNKEIQDGATGSSNQTNFSSMAMQKLTFDSLVYWHHEMGVDGFRFDLATVLGRMPDMSREEDWDSRKRFFEGHPLLIQIAQLAKNNNFEVIAEAWDLWGYEVGEFPPGWGEWNGRFRDGVRKFLKGDANTAEFINHFNGDWRHFNVKAGPQKSINFVDAHDGFTMFDLVSFNSKQNLQPFPFGPSDGGSDDNNSWDSGGDHSLRRCRWRNFWLTVFFARGVPMVVGGDEYGRTQNGNNNPWNLNSVGIWNNWRQAISEAPTREIVDPRNPNLGAYYDVVGQSQAPRGVNPLFEFAHFVAKLRADDKTLRQRIWGNDKLDDADVSYLYYRPLLDGAPIEGDRAVSVCINGEGIGGNDYLLMINMTTAPIQFKVPCDLGGESTRWLRIIDTAPWAETSNNFWYADKLVEVKDSYLVQAWSIAVLIASPSQESQLPAAARLGIN